MQNAELKKLLKEINKFQTSEIDDELFDKVEGEIQPGTRVEVHWQERESPDEGYAFALPGQEPDEWDICIHIPEMDNSDGIGDGEPVWAHLYNIAKLPKVLKVAAAPMKIEIKK